MAKASENGKLSAGELGQAALLTVQQLTGYRPEAVTGLRWDEESDTWCVAVDVLEMARIPNTTDVLGSYEVQLDDNGTLRGYRRLRRFNRSDTSGEQ
jgi:hypothetical protein